MRIFDAGGSEGLGAYHSGTTAEVMSQAVKSLFTKRDDGSRSVTLMAPVPNLLQHRANGDLFTPDPAQTSAAALRRFHFMGELMGYAYRSERLKLDFRMPPLVREARSRPLCRALSTVLLCLRES